MSFMFITCAWCGTEYTFGIVGRDMVGSGHTCTAVVPCSTEGCEEPGNFFVVGHKDALAEKGEFACSDHIGERVIVSTQPRSLEKS